MGPIISSLPGQNKRSKIQFFQGIAINSLEVFISSLSYNPDYK